MFLPFFLCLSPFLPIHLFAHYVPRVHNFFFSIFIPSVHFHSFPPLLPSLLPSFHLPLSSPLPTFISSSHFHLLFPLSSSFPTFIFFSHFPLLFSLLSPLFSSPLSFPSSHSPSPPLPFPFFSFFVLHSLSIASSYLSSPSPCPPLSKFMSFSLPFLIFSILSISFFPLPPLSLLLRTGEQPWEDSFPQMTARTATTLMRLRGPRVSWQWQQTNGT